MKYRWDFHQRSRFLGRWAILIALFLMVNILLLFYPTKDEPLRAATALELVREVQKRQGTLVDVERVLGPPKDKAFSPDSGMGFYGWVYLEESAYSLTIKTLWIVALPEGRIDRAELRSRKIEGGDLWSFRWKRFKERLGF